MSDVQIAIIDQQDTQAVLAVPGIQGPIGPATVAGTIPSGSVSEPGLAFDGDADTGLYQPGPNRFAFTTSGVLSCEVDAQGDFRYYGDAVFDDGGTYTTTLQMVTPTANRTISFPNATGTIALVAGSSGQVIYNNGGVLAGISTMTFDGTSVTMAGRLINSYTSLASAPAKVFTGTWFTGGTSTTTKPHFLIEPTGATSTAWSTSGTGLGVNAASGFGGRLMDLQTNGTSRMVVQGDGKVGVGTPTPAAPLHLMAESSVDGALIQRWGYVQADISNYFLTLKTGVSPGVVKYNFSVRNNGTDYNDVLVLDRGNVGIGTTTLGDKLEIGGAGAGIILASPDGTRYRLTVANGGTLSIAAV